MSIKQVILVRKDLGMSPGLVAAQVAHASVMAILNALQNDRLPDAVFRGHCCTKVVLGVGSIQELLDRDLSARRANIPVGLMLDHKPAFKKPTYTTLAIGPAHKTRLDDITGHLRLYK